MNSFQPYRAHELVQDGRDDEVDLAELLAVVWHGKWLIAGVTAAAALIAVVGLALVPSEYRIEMLGDGPSRHHIRVLQPSKLEGGEPYQLPAPLSEEVYRAGIAHADSLHVQRRFWEDISGETLNAPAAGGELTENDRAFRKFVGGLTVARVDPGEAGSVTRLSLDTDDPSAGVELLRDYVRFVDQYTIKRLVEDLKTGYETSLARLDEDMASLAKHEQLLLEDQLVRLGDAHELAKSLNIVETPYERVANVKLAFLDSREYLVGTAVLSQEINALKARQQGSMFAFVPELREMEQWQAQMQRDLRDLPSAATNVRAFTITNPPQASLSPVKPNRPLIFIAALFGAGLLGVILVLVRQGVRSYRARTAVE